METVIREHLGQIKVGRKQAYKNLALFPLLSTYRAALDALDRLEPEAEHKDRQGVVDGFLKDSLSATVENRPSVALGNDCRLVSPALAGFALVLDGEVLHLSMFPGNGREEGLNHGSRMQRLSARRRNRK